ncbi:MAG TPA: cysteine desulfurase [Alphaproteobacteria bacterium]|nr:MAG: cysteine desulfurase [SAR116 cluster bacterium]HCY47055.1 cysteine desulfurase [Alphaproteobacteria bacterium]
MANQPGRVYLDHHATSPLRPEALVTLSTMVQANPSSVHQDGREARRVMEECRQLIADVAGFAPRNVVFTSGGTEANQSAILGLGADTLFYGATEHPCVLAAANEFGRRGGDVSIIPVNAHGLIEPEVLASLLAKARGKVLVAIMAANNETGVAQDLVTLGRIIREHGALMHVDAVQLFGKCPIQSWAFVCDSMSISAHKFGGPQGVGALLLRDGLSFEPLIRGGGQELGRRSGTENMPGIVAMGHALKASIEDQDCYALLTKALRGMEEELCVICPDLMVAGMHACRPLPVSCLVAPKMEAQLQLIKADIAGFSLSSGSACSSGKVAPSHVLEAMGFDTHVAKRAIRVSAGWSNGFEDIRAFGVFYQELLQSQQ